MLLLTLQWIQKIRKAQSSCFHTLWKLARKTAEYRERKERGKLGFAGYPYSGNESACALDSNIGVII